MALVGIELRDLNDLIEAIRHAIDVTKSSEPELSGLLAETLDRVLGHLTADRESCGEAREIETIMNFIGHGGFRGS